MWITTQIQHTQRFSHILGILALGEPEDLVGHFAVLVVCEPNALFSKSAEVVSQIDMSSQWMVWADWYRVDWY